MTSNRWLLPIGALLMDFISLFTDLYLPAMREMAHKLYDNVEFTLTSFLVGFAVA